MLHFLKTLRRHHHSLRVIRFSSFSHGRCVGWRRRIHGKEVGLLRICVEMDELNVLPDQFSIFAYSEGACSGFGVMVAFDYARWMPGSRIVVSMGEFRKRLCCHLHSRICVISFRFSETARFVGTLTVKLVFNGRESSSGSCHHGTTASHPLRDGPSRVLP